MFVRRQFEVYLMVSALRKLRTTVIESRVGRVSKKSSQKKLHENNAKRLESKLKLREMAEETRAKNPFERKFTRVKHPVLGQRLKGVSGRVGESRKRGQEARKELGLALKRRNREGGVIDRYIFNAKY